MALSDFGAISEESAFRAWIEQERYLFEGSAAAARVKSVAESSAYGPYLRELAEIVDVALSDPERGWSQLSEHRLRIASIASDLSEVVDEVEAALAAGDAQQAVELATASLDAAREEGLGGFIFLLASMAGKGLLQLWGGDRSAEIERAGALLEEAASVAPTAEMRADALMHLGLAWGSRSEGDLHSHLKVGLSVLREALSAAREGQDAHITATVETNLGEMLLRQPYGDREAMAQDARTLALRALETRPVEGDLDDWAFSQMVYGRALVRLAESTPSLLAEGREALSEIFKRGDGLTNPSLAVAAERLVADSFRSQAALTPEAIYDAREAGTLDEWWENRHAALVVARRHYGGAVERFSEGGDHEELVRALLGWVETRDDGDGLTEALAASQRAFAEAAELGEPHLLAAAAAAGAAVAGELREWETASDLYDVALGIEEITLSGRIESESRAEHARAIGNAPRWAAYAMAKAGRVDRAIEVLERGRARDFARLRTASERDAAGTTEGLIDEIADELLSAGAQLVAAGLGGSVEQERRYQVALEAARKAGWQGDEDEVTLSGLFPAVSKGAPLIYINPTPAGTVLLKLAPGDDGLPLASAEFLDELTSTEVFSAMSATSQDVSAPSEPYILAGVVPDVDLPTAVEQICRWSGPRIAQHVGAMLERDSDSGVTLVPCGPVSLVPLHAAPWLDGQESVILLDRYQVGFAPSARAMVRTSPPATPPAEYVLVAIGDPEDNLPWAAKEVELIAQTNFADRCRLAFRSEATKQFLEREAPRADLLHLACHGRGALVDRDDAALALADGPLSAAELSRLPLSGVAVATASACQTAMATLADRPEEAFSLSTCLLAAGAGAAVASLWSVPDYETGLLMVRFYDALSAGETPRESLRQASLWLRDLTIGEAEAVVVRNPILSRSRDDWRQEEARSGERSPRQPFGDPHIWAAFTVHGT